MDKVVRYFAWNAMLIGILVLSSVFDWDTGIGLCGIYFGIEAFSYFFINMYPAEKLDDFFVKNASIFSAYKVPFEMLWIGVAFYLKHYIIGICMVITFCGFIDLWAKKIELDKKNKTIIKEDE